MNNIDFQLATTLITVQGVLLWAILFWTKKGERYPHRLLSFLILTLSLITFTTPQSSSNFIWEEVEAVLYYLLGPFIYLYFRSLSSLKTSSNLSILKHFIPAITITILFLISYMPIASKNFINLLYEHNWIGSSLLELTYIIFSMILLFNYRKTMQKSSAGSEQQLPTMFIAFLSVYSILFFIDIGIELFSTNELLYRSLPLLLTSIWFFAVIYLLLQLPRDYEVAKELLTSEQKYMKSALSKDESSTLFLKLTNVIKEKKIYLDPTLTLLSLSDEVGATTHEVSFCINNEIGENFSTFIGKFRVNEAKQLLSKNDKNNFSIQQIALQSGFSSKSTFNRIFKKIISKTPSQFLKSL